MDDKKIQFYRKSLPKEIRVLIHKAEGQGYWATIKGKGLNNCYTQAEKYSELVEMVNDAIFTHLDIPKKFRREVGIYLPKSIVQLLKTIKREEETRRHWQAAVKAIEQQSNLQGSEVFSLAQ